MSEEDLAREKLVADAIGIDLERGDSLTVSSAPFMNEILDGVKPQWYEQPFMRAAINQAGLFSSLALLFLVLCAH